MKIDSSTHKYVVYEITMGVVLFWIVVKESHVNTNSTTLAICLKLGNIDQYLAQVGHDVMKTNTRFRLLLKKLEARK